MKYKVIGWTECGTQTYRPHKHITACVDNAIINEIRQNGYCFGGDAHENYCPVLNDGAYVSYSWRCWGRIMAMAHGIEGDTAYMFAYMNAMIEPSKLKYPESKLPQDFLIVPKESLAETFAMHLCDEMFEAVKSGTKTVEVRLFDDKRKQIDIGDYIEFSKASNGAERVKMRVANLEIEETFEELFADEEYNKETGEWETRLKYSPQQLGSPEGNSLKLLVDGMYKYYDRAQEAKFGVMAIILEPAERTA